MYLRILALLICLPVLPQRVSQEDKKDHVKAAADLRNRIEASPELPFNGVPLPVQAPAANWESGLVSGLASDSKGVIYEVQRGDKADPVLVLDRDGKLLRSWGKGNYKIPHSIRCKNRARIGENKNLMAGARYAPVQCRGFPHALRQYYDLHVLLRQSRKNLIRSVSGPVGDENNLKFFLWVVHLLKVFDLVG